MKNRRHLLFPAAILLFCAQPLLGGEQNIYLTDASSNAGNSANWSLGANPFSNTSAGSYKDVLFESDVTDIVATGGNNSNMHVESYSVTNGNSYTLGISSSGQASFRAGATGDTAGESTAPFTNDVSGVAQDLVYLSGNSSLEFFGANLGTGTAPSFLLRQSGNFNILGGSTLTLDPVIAGSGSTVLTITGGGATIFNAENTYTGTTIIAGGTLEIVGSNSGNNYTINGNGEPVLKLSNLNALPVSATLVGSNSTTLDGTVDLAVAGAYTFDVYNRGHIKFTASSGSPTSLDFTGASKVTTGANSGRTFTNGSANLDITFGSTLDIGGDGDAAITFAGAGSTTITGGILSTGAGVRSLNKNGSGTLTLTTASAYAGTTSVSGGMLYLGDALAIPGGIGATGGTNSLIFDGGIIGLTAASGDFERGIGTGADQVQWNTGAVAGGFAAYGGDRLVNFGGAGAGIQWLGNGPFGGAGLILGASDSDSKITLVNGINLSSSNRTVTVNDGSAAVDAELSGVITSATGSLIKAGSGTLALTGENTYGGETKVSAGSLVINGISIADTGKLIIDGGKVEINGADEIVDTLYFGEAQQAAGTWGSSASPAIAPFIDDTHFFGTGTVTVNNGAAGGDYDTWLALYTFADGADTAPTGDADGDGLINQREYAFGLDPSSGSSVNPITVPLDKATGTFTYTRRKPSLTGLNTYKIWTSTTLAGWTVDEGASAGQSPTDAGDNQNVVVTLTGAPLTAPKTFVRVSAE